jgi:hypothetical protein
MRVCASVVTGMIRGVRYGTESEPSSCTYTLRDCHTDSVEEGCGMPSDMYDTASRQTVLSVAHASLIGETRFLLFRAILNIIVDDLIRNITNPCRLDIDTQDCNIRPHNKLWIVWIVL